MSFVRPFTPSAAGSVTLAVTNASSAATLGANNGDQILVSNIGSNVCYIQLGVGTTTATALVATSMPILPNSQVIVTRAIGATSIAAITSSGTSTLVFTPGFGN